jgi:hypothetical protein
MMEVDMPRFTGFISKKSAVTPLALLLLILAIALFTGVSAARATDPSVPPPSFPSSCNNTGSWCAYADSNYSGSVYYFCTGGSCIYSVNTWTNIGTLIYPNGISSIANDRGNRVMFSHNTSGSPPPNTKDCQNASGSRGNLHDYTYPDGTNENDQVWAIDMQGSAGGPTCP